MTNHFSRLRQDNHELFALVIFIEIGCAALLVACLIVIVGVVQAPWLRAVLYVSPIWLMMLIVAGFLMYSEREHE